MPRIAFDEGSRRAYVISATTGNDILDKLRIWLEIAPKLVEALAGDWVLRPVIISSQPSETLLGEDLRSCYQRKVLVLAAEQLTPLKESPPDLSIFARYLSQDPPDVTTPRSPFL